MGLPFSIVGGFVALFLALAVVAMWVGVEFRTRLEGRSTTRKD